ncbi:MAG: gamma-glutamyl-gamma-aminobutyrate hydrolase family protein [Pyrinomonadaceae bacterium]
MSRRPRIGITMRIDFATDRFYLSRHYSEAIAASGGTPLHISLIPDQSYIAASLDALDGILLPGSDSDVDPLRYGQQPHRALGAVNRIKDETDLLVIAEAEKRGLPILSICFGMQILNVARGGALTQDIASQMPEAIKHEQGAPRDRPSHVVNLLSGSLVNNLAGTTELLVNSHHHQAISTLGTGLTATAWSTDGLIEAVEDVTREKFVVGVQWHPELGWREDNFSQALFAQFIGSAQSRTEKRDEQLASVR